MLLLNEILPLLNGQFMMVFGMGVFLFLLSTRCQAGLAADRLQFVGFCSCATGSVTIIQSLARIYQH
jgi:hypothetical protein